MARASSAYTKLLLRVVWNAAKIQGITLYNALLAAAQDRIRDTQTGLVITTTQVGSHSVGRSALQVGGLSPVQIAETVSFLLDLYDVTRAADSEAADEEIYTTMLAEIQPVVNVAADFTGMWACTGSVN